MSNQTTGPSVFEIDQRTNLGREIILSVLLDSRGDDVSENEFEEMFEEAYSEEEDQEEVGKDKNNDNEEVEEEQKDDEENHRKSMENLEKVQIEESLMCSICLEKITSSIERGGGGDKDADEGRSVRIRKACVHMYHHKCILKWLINHHTCPPLCRFKITI
ncbi:hypothetical protein K1719_002251 [Acacia pycnantha]|nr:hypothetical protein K1719_002251 [Acacia pycnantha]